MRVLAVSSWFPHPPVNGAKLRAYEVLRQLASRHAVTLLSFAEAGEADGDEQAHLREFCESVTVVRGHPFKHGRLGLRGLLSPMPRSLARTFSREMAARVDAAVPHHDVTVGLQIGAVLYVADRRAAPAVFEEAEVTWLRALRDREARLARRARLAMTSSKYLRYVLRLVARTDRTTVVSDVERQALLDIGCEPARVRVVPNGVRREHLLFRPSRHLPRLVYPGAMTYSANADAVRWFVAEAWPAIRRARPDLSFVVTGSTEGVDLGDLEGVAGVEFSGHVADVKSFIGESAACVVPLRLGGGTRLKILEAMALGTPVVSTPKGAEGLAVTPQDDILIADRPDAFAREVVRVTGDEALAARLATNARALVDRSYTWDTIGATLDSVLDEAVRDFRQRGSTR
jgi:polysaccharide biosynthesis protein PslH